MSRGNFGSRGVGGLVYGRQALPPSSQAKSGTRFSAALSVISSVGPPLTVLTALLVYFGWARSDAQARAMGIDVSVFAYTVNDFVLRSINSVYIPLASVAVIALGWIITDRALKRIINNRRETRLIHFLALLVQTASTIATIALVVMIFFISPVPIFGPYGVSTGILISTWAAKIRRMSSTRKVVLSLAQKAEENTIVFILVTLFLFWGTADFAGTVGKGEAGEIQREVSTMPEAEIFSPDRLAIDAPNVSEERIDAPSGPLYHYKGLRLLVFSNGRYFLIHNGWTTRKGTVVIVPDNGKIRFEFGNSVGINK